MKNAVAVIYARYSSDLQKDTSIDDQIDHCRRIAERLGYPVIDVFADRAVSGASMEDRDELLRLMKAAARGTFQIVITESLSRLSRDMEDTAAIYKRLKFNEVVIVDTSGVVEDVHVGVGGIVNSQFIKNLAISVKRGRIGRVRKGLVPGKAAFGYRCVPDKANEKEIDAKQAQTVIRIAEEYAAGVSTRTICERLMTEGVMGPSGPRWNHQKLISGGAFGGMLGNKLYIGKLVYGATYQIKKPGSNRRINRKSKEAPIEVDVPHLRIIPQDLWDRVQAMRLARRRGKTGEAPRLYRSGGKDRVLVGILRCSECNGRMMVGQSNADGSPRVVCSFGARRIECKHTKSYCLKRLESIVFDGIKHKLTNRKALIEMTRAYHDRYVERQKSIRDDRDVVQQQLNRVTVQMDRIVTAIGLSDDPVEALVERLNKLKVEQAGLKERVRLIEAEGNIVSLHPVAIDSFAASMEALHKGLTSDADDLEYAPFRHALYNIFERIVVHPSPKRVLPEVTPYVRLSAILGFEMFPKMSSNEELLAAQGVCASKISAPTGSCRYQDRNSDEGLVSLGRWQQAA
jgi:site-specific DNA recombinase